MLRRTKTFVLLLALAAIALLAITSTVDLLPHRHDNIDERVCPICHPPVIGLQPTGLKLPSVSAHTWALIEANYTSVLSAPSRPSTARGPPRS